MSEPAPALALLEFDSISAGIFAGDAMVKASPVSSIHAGTVHPGKYLVMVSGDTASVDIALSTGRDAGGDHVSDWVFLPDVHPDVTAAIVGNADAASLAEEALGIVETLTVAAVIEAADAGVKTADVVVSSVRLADGLGGKGYVLFSGVVAEVEAAVEAAVARSAPHGTLVRFDVIAQLHGEMAENLAAELRFMKSVEEKT
ncbi:MAG TPA: BMC domain-containing protein [Acidimicrobiia bacterium]|nr:BMC domain-containing protein [Acidimicrobiia bacterium]